MLEVIDPSTGQCVARVVPDTEADVERKLQAAWTGWAHWRQVPLHQRGALLRRVAALMRERADALGRIMTIEMGKPIREARAEVVKSAWAAEHYAEHASVYLSDDVIASDAARSWVQHVPLGPVLGILPWNAPFWLAFRFCAPALMAGNTCLMKHDPRTPQSSEAITALFEEAGAPAGVFQQLRIKTPAVERVIRDRRVRAVSFTGSTQAGSIVASIAAEEIKPAVLELGGSDPAIVLDDADLDKAARTLALSRIINAGQSCIAAKRILVVPSVRDAFVGHLLEHLRALHVGDPRREETDVGPIAREDLRASLHRQVRTTVDEGARLLLGGELPSTPGFFYPVTLLDQVEPGMCAATQETFGPVAVVMDVADEEAAIRTANDSEYGLGASIWGATDRAIAMASRIEAGQVAINGIVKTDPRLPSGGVKRSGYGRELGPHGIRAFVNVQQVWVGQADPEERPLR